MVRRLSLRNKAVPRRPRPIAVPPPVVVVVVVAVLCTTQLWPVKADEPAASEHSTTPRTSLPIGKMVVVVVVARRETSLIFPECAATGR